MFYRLRIGKRRSHWANEHPRGDALAHIVSPVLRMNKAIGPTVLIFSAANSTFPSVAKACASLRQKFRPRCPRLYPAPVHIGCPSCDQRRTMLGWLAMSRSMVANCCRYSAEWHALHWLGACVIWPAPHRFLRTPLPDLSAGSRFNQLQCGRSGPPLRTLVVNLFVRMRAVVPA
jgi:hypothetical protein